MPWQTPTLEELRSLNRDNIQAKLRSGPMIPNSGLRVMADANAGLAYLTLLYLDWLSKQLLPDTAETEWLDRHANIWLTTPRKAATFAAGALGLTGLAGLVVPSGAQLTALGSNGTVTLQTTSSVTLGSGTTSVNVVALTSGVTGLAVGSSASFTAGIAGITGTAVFTAIVDGVDEETDDELRVRVLDRIQQPPMGGDAEDYVQWALSVAGVTRAWSAPNEMGVGTVTVRFMMDDVRKNTTDPTLDGFPLSGDVATVLAYLQTVRPVSLKDFFCVAPMPEPINFTIQSLVVDSTYAGNGAIAANVNAMLKEKARPGHAINGVLQPADTIYAAWVSEAILNTQGVLHFDLLMADHPMPDNGHIAVLGTITYT